jgi:hypothetical protein
LLLFFPFAVRSQAILIFIKKAFWPHNVVHHQLPY